MSRRPASPRARSASGAVPGAPRVAARRRPGSRRNTRPAARPAAAAPAPSADGGADQEPRSLQLARLISVRALVLGVVLLVAFSMLFPTVRAYLGQRAELDALAAEVATAEQTEKDLGAELARWDDQSYVEAQARERLAYVMPGETSYRVIDPEVVVEVPVVEGSAGTHAGPTLPAGGTVSPWYTTVWDSVRVAGEAPVPTPGAAVPDDPTGAVGTGAAGTDDPTGAVGTGAAGTDDPAGGGG